MQFVGSFLRKCNCGKWLEWRCRPKGRWCDLPISKDGWWNLFQIPIRLTVHWLKFWGQVVGMKPITYSSDFQSPRNSMYWHWVQRHPFRCKLLTSSTVNTDVIESTLSESLSCFSDQVPNESKLSTSACYKMQEDYALYCVHLRWRDFGHLGFSRILHRAIILVLSGLRLRELWVLRHNCERRLRSYSNKIK